MWRYRLICLGANSGRVETALDVFRYADQQIPEPMNS